MPNHIHAIVIIKNNTMNVADGDVMDVVDGDAMDVVETLRRNVSTNTNTESKSYNNKNKKMSKISPKKSSLSHMVREFKSAVTKNSRKINSGFAWQPRFYDHIIPACRQAGVMKNH